jgi:uncharacterized protein YbjT (DUF2867 family)
MRCVVTGATGYIGGRLVPRLLDQGHDVRAMARTPSKLADVPWREDAEVVRGDLTDVDSLAAAFDGADVVYYLVHSMGTSEDFMAEEERASNNVVDAARRAGVRRLVYLSGLHPADTELSPHLRSRTRVGEILLASGIETVVLQAGVVIGSGSASFEMIRHLTDVLPVMTTPKWVHNKIQPISIRDVLHYLVGAATVDVPESRAWDIGGPDVLEYGEMMQIYADVAGLKQRFIVVLPFLTPSIASWWVGLVTPIPSGLARPLVESLHVDAVMDNHDIDSLIPPPAGGLKGYRESVLLALKRIADGVVETSWNGEVREAPAEPLPTDPEWAGAVAYTLKRSGWTSASEEELWKVIESSPALQDWEVKSREPGRVLLLEKHTNMPAKAWLQMRVGTVAGRGSTYHQRLLFYPKGIPGRAYWYAGVRRHRKRFRQTFRDIMDRAG